MLNLATLQPSWNPGNLDATEATNVINHTTGVGTIDFSFRLLQRDLTPIEAPGAPSWDPAELPAQYVYAGMLTTNTQSDTPTSMAMDLIEYPGLSYDPMHMILQPHLDYYARVHYQREQGGNTRPCQTQGKQVHRSGTVSVVLAPVRSRLRRMLQAGRRGCLCPWAGP